MDEPEPKPTTEPAAKPTFKLTDEMARYMIPGPSNSKPINNTKWRIRYYRAMHWLSRTLTSSKLVQPIPGGKCIKKSHETRLTEASTLRWVAEHTSVPVPKLYAAFEHKGEVWIVMQKIKGRELGAICRRMSEEQRDSIWLQLKKIVDELRSLKPEHEYVVANVDGGSLYDFRVDGPPYLDVPRHEFGPFTTIQDFHRCLRHGIPHAQDSYKHAKLLNDMIELHERQWPPVKFTHCDLNSWNIMIRNGKIVAILDWESAGWYPHYWEWTCACNVAAVNLWLERYLDRFLEPFPEAWEKMESTRWRFFGPWSDG